MYVRLLGENLNRIFNIWVYDDKGLVRGSGLFIDKSGISSNHHFLLPQDDPNLEFIEGDYQLQIFVEEVGKKPKMIHEQKLKMTDEQSKAINLNGAGVYFDWAQNAQNYQSYMDKRPQENEKFEDHLKLLAIKKEKK